MIVLFLKTFIIFYAQLFMTNEDKELLLRDLCGRIPYSVKISVLDWDEREMEYMDKVDVLYSVNGDEYIQTVNSDYNFNPEDIKPYLFPMSSMTEEQKKEFDQLLELELKAISDEIDHTEATAFEVDFYNKHHLDWRGLIPKGLAEDATDKNIY